MSVLIHVPGFNADIPFPHLTKRDDVDMSLGISICSAPRYLFHIYGKCVSVDSVSSKINFSSGINFPRLMKNVSFKMSEAISIGPAPRLLSEIGDKSGSFHTRL